MKSSYYYFSHIFELQSSGFVLYDAFERDGRTKSNYKETVNLIFVWVLLATMHTVNLVRLSIPYLCLDELSVKNIQPKAR